MPPINELTRIEPVYLAKLERQGIFTTGLLLEVSETPARRQYLADHVDASTNDVGTWRDEALMLNLAGFGPDEHQLFIAGADRRACATSSPSTSSRSSERLERARAPARTSTRPTQSPIRAGGTRRGRSKRSRRPTRATMAAVPGSLGRSSADRLAAIGGSRRPVSALVIVAGSLLLFNPLWVGFEQARTAPTA